VDELNAGVRGGAEEGVEDGVGFVGGGEELAGVLALEGDAEVLEERDGLGDIEAAEDLADGVGRGAGVLLLVDLVVRDVAAAAAGDEDLGAEFFGAVEGNDAGVGRCGAAGPDGGEEAGGAGADDGDVGVSGQVTAPPIASASPGRAGRGRGRSCRRP
jgi:hypothetical protein